MFPYRFEVIHLIFDKKDERFCHAPLIQEMGRV